MSKGGRAGERNSRTRKDVVRRDHTYTNTYIHTFTVKLIKVKIQCPSFPRSLPRLHT